MTITLLFTYPIILLQCMRADVMVEGRRVLAVVLADLPVLTFDLTTVRGALKQGHVMTGQYLVRQSKSREGDFPLTFNLSREGMYSYFSKVQASIKYGICRICQRVT